VAGAAWTARSNADARLVTAARIADEPGARRDPAPETQLNVLVSEGDGGIQIVAASTELSADVGAALKKVASDVASEFGLTLSEFSLNGNPVRPRLESIGGLNGSRAR